MHDLELVNIDPQSTHGSLMRYTIAHKGIKKISQNVVKLIGPVKNSACEITREPETRC